MNPKVLLCCLLSLAGLLTCGLPPAEATEDHSGSTNPVGVFVVPLPAGSDRRIAIPFLRPSRHIGIVQSVAGNVLTLAGAPNWSANQFAFAPPAGQHDTFFVLLGPGPNGGTVPTPKEGSFYTVTANGANTLTVDLNGDDLSAVQPGTRVSLIPYWTLGTAFPATDAGKSFVVSASPSQRAATILVAEPKTTVIDGPSRVDLGGPESPPTYYFYAGAWRRGDLSKSVVCDDDVFLPDNHFIVHNPGATTLTFQPTGVVLAAKITVPVPAPDQNSILDYPVGLPRPLAMTLDESNLAASGAIGDSNGDAVLVFDHVAAGFNQAPSARYFFSGGAWRKEGAPATQDFGGTPLAPASGLILHKEAGSGVTVFWLNTPNYLND